jgi:hypothetical protein
MVPLATAISTFYVAQIKTTEKIAHVRYEAIEKYAQKDTVQEMNKKLDNIGAAVSEIKGYLFRDNKRVD